MSGKLSGKTAIITGSSSGIGKSIAESYLAEGANVVINSRKQSRADETAAELQGSNGDVLSIEADVSDPESVQELVAEAVDEFGELNVFVNNAGKTEIDHAENLTTEQWQSVIDVNLTGVFYGSQAAGQQMISQGDGGQIISISSAASRTGFPGRAPYSAAKAGVNNLTRTLAAEWGRHGIHVNGLAPGFIKTKLSAEAGSKSDEEVEDRTPLGRWGSLEEMAHCATFLATGDHFISGEIIHADGGWATNLWGTDNQFSK